LVHSTNEMNKLTREKICSLNIMTLILPFEQFAVCTEPVIWTLNCLVPIEVHYMEKNPGMFSSKTLISF